ncbi:MAG: peptidoglycan-binding LysM [Bacteroidetes bacterium OLB11]|nr:MAG: peptidoglycan-binding LysM [Bacteroidetes bacterium OLB11]
MSKLLNGKETTNKEKSPAIASNNRTTPNPTTVKRNYNSYYKPGNVLYEKGIKKTTPKPTPKVALKKDTIKSKVQVVPSNSLTPSNQMLKMTPSKNIAVAEAKNVIPKTSEKSINSKTITKPFAEMKMDETKLVAKKEVKDEAKIEAKNEIKHEIHKENVIRNEIKSLSLTSSATGKSAYFYSGIVNGKIYAISNLSNKGEIIKVTNLSNGKSVYAEIMDNLPAKDIKSGIILKLSDNAKLPLDQKNNTFNVKINY